jgi:hypothetical protein
MRHPKEYLLLSIVLCNALVVTGCAVHPSNQNQTTDNSNSYNNQKSTPVDISDLDNTSASYAVQQLRIRGFNQVGAKPASSTGVGQSWWLNLPTNQCFQLDIANNKVMTLTPKSSQDCHNTR